MSFLKDPVTRKAAKAHVGSRATKNYAALLEMLDIGLEEAAFLTELVSEKELALVETYLENRSESPEVIALALGEIEGDYNRRIEDLLGVGGYDAYQFYVKTLPLRRGVEKFENYIRFSTEPLSSDQKEALVSGIGEMKEVAGKSFGGYPLLGQNWEDPKEDSVEVAQAILSEGQLARYLDYLGRNKRARSAMALHGGQLEDQASRR